MSTTTLSTCVDIILLLHYHCFTVEHPDVARRTEAAAESIERLFNLELLAPLPVPDSCLEASWKTTEKGRVMIAKLLACPIPVATWS